MVSVARDTTYIAHTNSNLNYVYYFVKCLGGSEKFQDKQSYFYKEVCQLSKSAREEKTIEVRRSYLLEDVCV